MGLQGLLDSRGQTFVRTAINVFADPIDQDTVSALFKAVGNYLGEIRTHTEVRGEITEIRAVVESQIATDTGPIHQLWEAIPELRSEIRCMLFLAHLDENLLTPILGLKNAVGSVMKKKIHPVLEPLLIHLTGLLGEQTDLDLQRPPG